MDKWKPGEIMRIIAMLVLAWVGAGLPASAARAVIQPGESAPALAAEGATSGVMLIVFVKSDDRHTSEGLAALEGMFAQYPVLSTGTLRRVVVSRLTEGTKTPAWLATRPGWKVVVDAKDEAYEGYRIVATPTVVIVAADRKVAAVHAGYDPGMVQDVRLALARAKGIGLPPSAEGTPAPPPDMNVQMARRMVSRGLWERALHYFDEATSGGKTLPEVAKPDLARAWLGMEDLARAEAVIKSIAPGSPAAAEVPALTEQLERARRPRGAATPAPPRITR